MFENSSNSKSETLKYFNRIENNTWWIEKRNLGSAFATAGAGTAGAGSTGAVCYCCHLQHRYDVVKPAKRIIPC
ncbi:hypothetical protein HZH66_003491 [Vespula vulgaris]|uniref:Uncharacterized protein n=1 Tax=Vespula vulgaris TaxID=7454 RepID=A0A834ND46_VESVU|nr:hypothetical protein HZH66_003491 [Vespula vulgaris]